MTTNEKGNFPESKKIRRLTMWAPDPGSETGERASLEFALRGPGFDSLEIVVWPRNPNEKNKPPIRASLNSLNVQVLLDNIRYVAKAPGKDVADLPVRTMRRIPDTDKREIYDQATIRVVQTAEGIIMIGIFDSDESRTRILFPFTLDQWTGMVKRSGEPMSESDVSKMVALRSADLLDHVMKQNMLVTTDTENKAMFPRAGESNGAARGRGNRQQSSNRADDFTTDSYL